MRCPVREDSRIEFIDFTQPVVFVIMILFHHIRVIDMTRPILRREVLKPHTGKRCITSITMTVIYPIDNRLTFIVRSTSSARVRVIFPSLFKPYSNKFSFLLQHTKCYATETFSFRYPNAPVCSRAIYCPFPAN